MFIALFIKIVASGYTMYFFTKHQFFGAQAAQLTM